MPNFAHWKYLEQVINMFNEHRADSLIAAYIFEIWNKKFGSVL